MSVSVFLSLTLIVERTFIQLFIVVIMSLENASLDCSVSPVTKKDPGLEGPDIYTFGGPFFKKKSTKL